MIGPYEVGIELGRTLTSVESAQVQQWIDDAYAIIAARYPGGTDPVVTDRAVRTVVARYSMMPKDGAQAHEVGVDDARTVRRYGSGSTVTLASLLGPWWAELDPGTHTGQAFTITPGYR